MKTTHDTRYTIVGSVFALVGLIFIARMVYIQVGPPNESLQSAEKIDSTQWIDLTPARGSIFDRRGRLLAGNQQVYEVAIELNYVINPESIALAANMILGLDYNEVYRIANQDVADVEVTHFTLDNFATNAEAERLRELKQKLNEHPETAGISSDGRINSLVGLEINPRLGRSYPEKSLASNVIGFINKEGDSHFGVEEELDGLLSGVKKQIIVSVDPNRALELPDTPNVTSIILTLDREIQVSIEEILDKALAQTGAYSGTIVVMSPKTGDILGMASSPRMNLNEYWRLNDIFMDGQTFNLAVDGYESGSVFKIITMAAALDTGTVTPNTEFIDTGSIVVGGRTIYNWDRGAWGPQNMITCLQHSLNVCLAWVGTQVGPTDFYRYIQDFGFGQLTGISVAREYAGHLRLPSDASWYEIDLGTNSFGQGIEVTPVQMLQAISAVANDGEMVTPRILHAVVSQDRQYDIPLEPAGTPISAETAHTLSEMLAVSLEKEASSSLLPGYRLAGKTGTGEIYNSGRTNASFVGWGPVDDPQFMVYIWLKEPVSSPWASIVAAPVFHDVAERLVVLMDIPPDQVRIGMTSP
ncbi:MAG: penicillin-binding protein 2 [Chloroflexota bacterium]|nr:penicillin-binding protein 2 [Chloroflexota bacterium]